MQINTLSKLMIPSFSILLLIVSISTVHSSYYKLLAQEPPFLQQQPSFPPLQQEQQPSFPPQQSSLGLIPYENPQLGVRVLVPSDSQIIEELQGYVNLASSSVQIVIGLATLPSYDQTLEQLVTEAQSDPSVVAIQETVLSNNVGFVVILRYPETAEFEEIDVIQFFTLYDNNFYALQFMLNAADLETLNPLLMQMHSSYQIIG